jgi:hypothetical protein
MLNINEKAMLVLNFFDQNSCGEITLQVIIVQYAQAYGPVARFRKAYCSA